MASDTSHPPSRLDPRSTACTQRTTDLGADTYRRTQTTKKKIDKTDSQPEYTVPKCQPNGRKKLYAACTDSLESKITPFCTEHVGLCPGVPDFRRLQPPCLDWSDGIPLEVDEDVLVPYWENLHEDLFLDEAVLRQFVCTYERQEHDLWTYLGPE